MTSQLFPNALHLEDASWIRLQEKLFYSHLSRLEISEFTKSEETPSLTIRVRVWRNYACEPMESIVRIVGRYWNVSYEFTFTGYDDSFTFVEFSSDNISYDYELLLVDTNHYQLKLEEIIEWINQRCSYLQQVTNTPVIFVTLGDQIDFWTDGKVISTLFTQEFDDFYDQRYEKTTGSRLRPNTHYQLGLELAATWLPERRVPPKKLLAIDLDFTLHAGVLGEEGNRVVVNDGYKKLQSDILEAKKRGLMLAIISKNNREDVLNLLQNHPDYVLRESDFVLIEASWGTKPDAMLRILEQTRINHDAVVFIDDNPVELMQMAAAFPNITCVSVDAGPAVATKTLQFVPGFRRSSEDHAADVRVKDLQSNEDRERLIANGLAAYYDSAQPVLKVSIGQSDDLERLVDLGKRSNQFNLLLARSEKSEYMASAATWVSLSLEDRFSDSGIIGGILCIKSADNVCKVVDLFLSCRVLGRGLETSLICAGLMEATKALLGDHLQLSWVIGERNEPALSWIAKELTKAHINDAGSITLSVEDLEELSHPPTGVKIEIKR